MTNAAGAADENGLSFGDVSGFEQGLPGGEGDMGERSRMNEIEGLGLECHVGRRDDDVLGVRAVACDTRSRIDAVSGEKPSTPAPTSSTTPATSVPKTRGRVWSK